VRPFTKQELKSYVDTYRSNMNESIKSIENTLKFTDKMLLTASS